MGQLAKTRIAVCWDGSSLILVFQRIQAETLICAPWCGLRSKLCSQDKLTVIPEACYPSHLGEEMVSNIFPATKGRLLFVFEWSVERVEERTDESQVGSHCTVKMAGVTTIH